jgi:hypothetical protein
MTSAALRVASALGVVRMAPGLQASEQALHPVHVEPMSGRKIENFDSHPSKAPSGHK